MTSIILMVIATAVFLPSINCDQAPKFAYDENFKNIEVEEGESIQLECDADGSPTPEYRWELHHRSDMPKTLPNGELVHYGNTLKISYVHRLQRGFYHCVAENSAGRVVKTFNLQVEFPPKMVELSEYRSEDEILLNCEVESNPLPNFIWLKNDQEISRGTKGFIFTDKHYNVDDYRLGTTLSILIKNNHYTGAYKCVAKRDPYVVEQSFFV